MIVMIVMSATDPSGQSGMGSSVDEIDQALEVAAKGWTVVDMKRDRKTIFPPASKPH